MILFDPYVHPWEGALMRCGHCHAGWELEHKDIRRPGFKPWQEDGRWLVRTTCDECGKLTIFREGVDA